MFLSPKFNPMRLTLALAFALLTHNMAYSQLSPFPTTFPGYYNGGSLKIGPSIKHKFDIVLKNDSAFTVTTRIVVRKDTNTVSFKKGNESYTLRPGETKSISVLSANGERIIGVPADSCWLFKVNSGRINSYSYVPEENMLRVVAIQRGEFGPIVPLNVENLSAMIGDDPKIRELVQAGKFAKAIKAFNKE
jgi:hypothetical protein